MPRSLWIVALEIGLAFLVAYLVTGHAV